MIETLGLRRNTYSKLDMTICTIVLALGKHLLIMTMADESINQFSQEPSMNERMIEYRRH